MNGHYHNRSTKYLRLEDTGFRVIVNKGRISAIYGRDENICFETDKLLTKNEAEALGLEKCKDYAMYEDTAENQYIFDRHKTINHIMKQRLQLAA